MTYLYGIVQKTGCSFGFLNDTHGLRHLSLKRIRIITESGVVLFWQLFPTVGLKVLESLVFWVYKKPGMTGVKYILEGMNSYIHG